MTTFAQTYDNTAHNVVIGNSFPESIEGVFNEEWVNNETLAGRPWCIVPDGTIVNATFSGGVWTNPTPPTPTLKDLALDKTQFLALYNANNNNITDTLTNWPKG